MALTLTPEDLSAIADSVWDEVLNGSTHNIPSSAGRRLRQLSNSVIIEVVVVSATANTITFDGDASTQDGAYDPAAISIVEGTGAGQTRLIFQYTGSTKTAIIDRDWKVIPNGTSVAIITAHPGREHVNEGSLRGVGTDTAILNAQASPNDDEYVGQVIFIRSGQGSDQACRIIDYNGTTKEVKISKNWKTLPAVGSGYVLLPTAVLDIDLLIEDFWSYTNRTLTSFGTLVSDIWSNIVRTLTSTPEQTLEQTSGENVIVQRGDTLTWDFSGLGSLVGRTSLYITVKNNKNTEDSSSTIQASQSAGLLVLNGSTTGITAGWSVITILNESLGNIRWTLSAEATKLLSPVLESNYDIQISTSTSVRTLRSGTFTVNSDVTRRLV